MTLTDNIHQNGETTAARHAPSVTRGLGALMWSFFLRLKWQYLPLVLSDYAREILRRKYDAIATDRAYENRPSGMLGPLGRSIDRLVLSFPVHEGLRERLRIVVDSLKADMWRRLRDGEPEVRVLSAPCGVIRDILTAAAELRAGAPGTAGRIRLHALDLDATGEVIPVAQARAEAAGVPVTFYREDLFNSPGLEAKLGMGERFHVVNCIGLASWLTLEEVERLACFFHDRALVKGGTLIIDNFATHKHSALGDDLEIYTRYHDPQALLSTLEKSGFEVMEANTTANGVTTVYTARAR